MYQVFTSTRPSQSRTFTAVNSDPLSLRIKSGTPRRTNRSLSRSKTPSLVSCRATSIAKHSRVYSSISISIRKARRRLSGLRVFPKRPPSGSPWRVRYQPAGASGEHSHSRALSNAWPDRCEHHRTPSASDSTSAPLHRWPCRARQSSCPEKAAPPLRNELSPRAPFLACTGRTDLWLQNNVPPSLRTIFGNIHSTSIAAVDIFYSPAMRSSCLDCPS